MAPQQVSRQTCVLSMLSYYHQLSTSQTRFIFRCNGKSALRRS